MHTFVSRFIFLQQKKTVGCIKTSRDTAK